MKLAVILVVLSLAHQAHADVLVVGDKLAELDVAVGANARPFKLAALRGRWVLVTVGAEWCGPCRKELPVWDRIGGEFAGRLVFVALDIDDDIADGKRFHQALKLRHMTLVYLPQERSAVVGRYGASTLPTTFVADPAGVIRYVHPGFDGRDPDGEYARMKAVLAKLVPAAKPKEPMPKPKPPRPDIPRGLTLVACAACTPGTLWSPRWRDLLRF